LRISTPATEDHITLLGFFRPGSFYSGKRERRGCSKKLAKHQKEAAASAAAASSLILKASIYLEIRGPRAAASAGRAHF
jgi:hypothetical protein